MGRGIFHDILDQDQATESLASAFASGRMPHGLIFAGMAGVGKRTTADRLAQLFMCHHPNASEAAPCGKCPSCKTWIGSGSGGVHPDFHVCRREDVRLYGKKDSKARDLAVDVITEGLVRPASLSSALGSKVFVVEEADLMNAHAQNALLKTLEEPIGKTLIILLAEAADQLLPTIRSRCRLISFGPLRVETVKTLAQRQGVPADVVQACAELAEGSAGNLISWHNIGLLGPARQIVERVRAAVTGSKVRDLAKMIQETSKDVAEQQLKKDKEGSADMYKRQTLVLLLTLATKPVRSALRHGQSPAQLERLCCMIDALAEAASHIEANGQIDLVLQNMQSRLNSKQPLVQMTA